MAITSFAAFGRSEASRLLGIEEWEVAKLASDRYPFRLTPSLRGPRKMRGLYSLTDLYRLAIAARLLAAGLGSREAAAALNAIDGKAGDFDRIARDRAATPEQARYILIDLARASWLSRERVPPEWCLGDTSSAWVSLATRDQIAARISGRSTGIRAAVILPFDDLLIWVDSRILGREMGFGEQPPDYLLTTPWAPSLAGRHRMKKKK